MRDPTTEHSEAAYGHDAGGVLAVFHWREEEDPAESKVQGHPVYRLAPYVKVILPGDSKTVLVQRMKDEHRKRWPDVARAFDAKQAGIVDGTPIHELTALNRAQVATLKAAGIHTVEMLANLPDSRLSMWITREMRDRAQQSRKSAPEVEQELRRRLAELETEVRNLAIRNSQLEAAVAASGADDHANDMADAVDVALTPPKRKPGRPRKAA